MRQNDPHNLHSSKKTMAKDEHITSRLYCGTFCAFTSLSCAASAAAISVEEVYFAVGEGCAFVQMR